MVASQTDPADDNGDVSEGPRVGGDLVVGLAGDPYSIAPWVSNDMSSAILGNLVTPPLMATDKDGNKIPYILKDYEISDDAMTYVMTIHDGLTWHDGVPFTAEDIAFTAEYTVKHSLGHGADMFSNIESSEVVDDTTVKFFMKEPQVNLMTQVGFWINMMPKHVYEDVEEPMNFDYDGIGYGPFKFREYKSGEYYTLEKSDWPLLMTD